MSFLTFRSKQHYCTCCSNFSTNRAHIELISFGTQPSFNPILKEFEINVVLFQISLFGL